MKPSKPKKAPKVPILNSKKNHMKEYDNIKRHKTGIGKKRLSI